MYKNDYLITADEQAQAIRKLLLSHKMLNKDTIGERFDYPYLKIHDWFNGRERGYVLNAIKGYDYSLNIAFYEHRNSDSVHLLLWNQRGFNPVCTIGEANLEGIAFLESKWNTYTSYGCGSERIVANDIVDLVYEFLSNPKEFIDTLYANYGMRIS